MLAELSVFIVGFRVGLVVGELRWRVDLVEDVGVGEQLDGDVGDCGGGGALDFYRVLVDGWGEAYDADLICTGLGLLVS